VLRQPGKEKSPLKSLTLTPGKKPQTEIDRVPRDNKRPRGVVEEARGDVEKGKDPAARDQGIAVSAAK